MDKWNIIATARETKCEVSNNPSLSSSLHKLLWVFIPLFITVWTVQDPCKELETCTMALSQTR